MECGVGIGIALELFVLSTIVLGCSAWPAAHEASMQLDWVVGNEANLVVHNLQIKNTIYVP